MLTSALQASKGTTNKDKDNKNRDEKYKSNLLIFILKCLNNLCRRLAEKVFSKNDFSFVYLLKDSKVSN